MTYDWRDPHRPRGLDKRHGLGRRIMRTRRHSTIVVPVERRTSVERRGILARRSGNDRRRSADTIR